MVKRRRITVLVLVLGLYGLASLLPGGSAARATGSRLSLSPPLGGVNIPDLTYESVPAQADRAIAQARNLHARIVRVEVPWSVLEPNGPDRTDPRATAFIDRLMSDAGADGIGVVMQVDSSPCWASSAPAALRRMCVPGRVSRANEWPPRDPADYAAVVEHLVHRYSSQLTAIEVWNEPDQANQHYFAGPDKPRRYAALLRAAYPAIKRGDSRVRVLAGSLVGSNGIFLRALYAAGIKGYYDGLAVHFYTLTLAALRAIHGVQVASGDSKPLWLDEFGWSSCWPRHRIQQRQACVTAPIQAVNFLDTFRTLARVPYIAADVVYELQGLATEDFGVLTEGGARKPAFAALSRVLSSPFGRVSPVTLSLRRRGSQTVASGSGPVGDYMGLEVLEQGVPRYRALFTLDRFNRYSLALPPALGTVGLQVRVFQYWTGPATATQRGI